MAENKNAKTPTDGGTGFNYLRASAITVLRQAQEPVAWTPQVWRQFRPDGTLEFQKIKRTPNGEWEDYTAPPKRDLTCVCGAVWEDETMVHPPRKREWVGLTDEEIMEPWPFENRIAFARWLESKIKEKNHG